MLESTRAKEEAVKKETSEQLEIFRRQREEADKAALDDPGTTQDVATGSGSPVEGESWTTSKKRRRGKEKDALKGIKLRKTSSAADDKDIQSGKEGEAQSVHGRTEGNLPVKSSNALNDTKTVEAESTAKLGPPASPPKIMKSVLGLGDYSSDED